MVCSRVGLVTRDSGRKAIDSRLGYDRLGNAPYRTDPIAPAPSIRTRALCPIPPDKPGRTQDLPRPVTPIEIILQTSNGQI